MTTPKPPTGMSGTFPKRTRMTGSDPYPCTCGHDIEQHVPAYDYGAVDVCMGKMDDGSRCPCDGFRIRVAGSAAPATKPR